MTSSKADTNPATSEGTLLALTYPMTPPKAMTTANTMKKLIAL